MNPESFSFTPLSLAAMGPTKETSFEQLQQNLQEAQELAHIGSWEWDINSNTLFWSDEQYRLFGEEKGRFSMTYEGYLSHLSEVDRAQTDRLVKNALEGKGDYAVEHEIIRPNGTRRLVLEKGRVVFGSDGKLVRMYGITQDLTDPKESEAALKDKQKAFEVQAVFLSTIVDNIPAAVFIKDVRDNFRVTLWNKSAETIFQVKKEEIIGKTAHDLWPKDQADLFLAADKKVASENKMVAIAEEPSHTKDRGTIYLNTIKAPLCIHNPGEPDFLLCICHDITRTKEVTAELKAAKEAAETANRAKSEFLAIMSHEIRTPLNGVMGMANLLQASLLTPEQQDMLMTMRHSDELLLALISDVLDYSKIEADRMDLEIIPFDIQESIHKVIEVLSIGAKEKGLTINVNFPPHTLNMVMGDPTRTRQVLLNLIGNAIKFTTSGSVTLNAESYENRLRINVIDTGIGIAKENRDRIFKKFSQADTSTTRQYGGTGLGLIISKRLMELMGSKIEFTSQLGKGSTFFFSLPFCENGEVKKHSSESSLQKILDGPKNTLPEGLRVLLAEDNTLNQKVALMLLKRMGCIVDLAQNGIEAVEKAKQFPYHAILMDIHMPGMDGLEATRNIRAWENGSEKPVLIFALSASAMKEDRANCIEAGMNDFITKPIMPAELYKLLNQAAQLAL